MKRIICLFAALVLAFASVAIADIDLSAMTDDELLKLKEQIEAELSKRQENTSEEVVFDDSRYGKCVYTGYVLDELYENKCIILQFRFTNTTNKSAIYLYTLAMAFQDGIGLEKYALDVDDKYISQVMMPYVQPGYSCDFCLIFALRNDTSPVEVESYRNDAYLTLPIK